jgi:hypothetical protein
MKIPIKKMSSLTVLSDGMSLKLHCAHQLSNDEVKNAPSLWISVEDRKFPCSYISTNLKKQDSPSILVRLSKSFDTVCALFHLIGEERDTILMTEEVVDPILCSEADALLARLVNITGKSRERLLVDLTSFKKGRIGARDELKFVSAKQLQVVVNKMKDMLIKQDSIRGVNENHEEIR